MDFFWNVFYKKGLSPIEENELKIIHEHEQDMDMGISDYQALEQFALVI